MGCKKCKDKRISINPIQKEIDNSGIGSKILIFFVKLVVFLFTGPIVAIIVIPFSLYMLFNVLFLEGNVDITSGLVGIGKMLTGKDVEEESDEEDDEDDDEYEEIGIEDITEDLKK